MSFEDGCHPLFGFSEEERQEVRKELGLKENVIKEDVDMLLEWFEKQPHLIAAGLPDRSFVERMLITAKGSREKTKRRLDSLYRHRAMMLELLQNRSKYIDSKDSLWTFYRQTSIPKLYELKRITVLQFTDPDANNFEIEVLVKNSLMLGDLRMRYDYMLGDIWILDLKNTSFSHLLRINPLTFSKASRIFQDGFGIRLYGIHVLGAPSYVNQLLQFMSQFIKPKLMERIMVHDTVEDLYKHVPREYLPKEFGGEQPSLKLASEKYMQVLRTEETKKILEECSKQISDETRRPGDFITEDYLPGTFKKLDLD